MARSFAIEEEPREFGCGARALWTTLRFGMPTEPLSLRGDSQPQPCLAIRRQGQIYTQTSPNNDPSRVSLMSSTNDCVEERRSRQ